MAEIKGFCLRFGERSKQPHTKRVILTHQFKNLRTTALIWERWRKIIGGRINNVTKSSPFGHPSVTRVAGNLESSPETMRRPNASEFMQLRAQVKSMKNTIITCVGAVLLSLPAGAQVTQFQSGHLAVLRAGDGVMDLHLRQTPMFVDQFDGNASNAAPSFTVRIPTSGPDELFINGHAATEGNLTRSADHTLLAFEGYGGVGLLQTDGTPSTMDIPRGGCTIDASGKVHAFLFGGVPAGTKANPRGLVTDGKNNFWGCGNASGAMYVNPVDQKVPVRFAALPNTRAVKIIGNTLYMTVNAADAYADGKKAGIYGFQPEALPHSEKTEAVLVVPTAEQYKRVVGFDMNTAGTIAYTSDTSAGIQKYVKSAGEWSFAYNFAIPQVIPAAENNSSGCFGLAVDFSGKDPIIYATTTEGYGSSVNSNRVVKIVDTGAKAVVVTLACTGSTNVVFRGIDFTPEAKASAMAAKGN